MGLRLGTARDSDLISFLRRLRKQRMRREFPSQAPHAHAFKTPQKTQDDRPSLGLRDKSQNPQSEDKNQETPVNKPRRIKKRHRQMAKGSSSSGRGKKTKTGTLRPFKDFHSDWISTLRSTLLPNLRRSLSLSSGESPVVVSGGALTSSSGLLSSHASALLSHFQAYYHALDLAARHDASQLLSPHPWRSPLEVPFLWLGDFHPSLFTNLLRTLISVSSPSPHQPPLAAVAPKIEQLERGIRLMAPSIAARFRDAQALFAERAAAAWREGAADEEVVREQVEELEAIFGDANRLRRSVLGDLVGAADAYQGAIFLEALADFVLGFWDEDLTREFQRCRPPPSSP